MSKTLIAHIASLTQARRTCLERMSQPLAGDVERWYHRHNAALSVLLERYLPSGSGWSVALVAQDPDADKDIGSADRFVFDVNYHAMKENGFYVGYAEFLVTVTPSFIDHVNLDIEQTATTEDDAECGLLDQVGETMHECLTQEIASISDCYSEAA